tara:strand:- start:583 stop:750 length:168 start_codon:yes stop_codon:yes gene_type:complete
MMDGTIQTGFADPENVALYREGKVSRIRVFWSTTGVFHNKRSVPVNAGKAARMDN